MASNNALVLIDMSNFIHRSFHSLSPEKFRNENNEATNALYGTLNLVLNVISTIQKEYQYVTPVACFDTAKSKLSRMSIDENYKSQRPSAPRELKHQFEWVRTLIDTMQIANVAMDSCEADDVIASICHKYNTNYSSVIIVATDKDFCQCLTKDNVKIYNIVKKEFVTANDVYEKYKVIPKYFTLYQALVGDKVDNISGVKGIGPKIAPVLVNQAQGEYSKLLELAREDRLPKNKSKLICDNEEVLNKSLQLVTLSTNLNIENNFRFFEVKSLKTNVSFKNFIRKMNFMSTLQKYC